MPTLYGVPLSPFVRKARLALAEKGVDYDLVPVFPFGDKSEIQDISPVGKIPAYRDGDFGFSDSSVICAYLEKTVPSPALYPSGAQDYARALWLEEFADYKMADVMGTVFFNRYVKPKIMGEKSDEAAVNTALTEGILPVLDFLTQQLGSDDFFVGNTFSVADLAIATHLIQLEIGDERVDDAAHPDVANWLIRVRQRPSFVSCEEAEKAMLAEVG